MDDGELRETNENSGLMRYGGVGCLERQPGRASDNRLIGLGNGVWSKVDCWRHSGIVVLSDNLEGLKRNSLEWPEILVLVAMWICF